MTSQAISAGIRQKPVDIGKEGGVSQVTGKTISAGIRQQPVNNMWRGGGEIKLQAMLYLLVSLVLAGDVECSIIPNMTKLYG